MKRLSVRIALATALAVMASLPLAYGQGARVLKVNVPFSFEAAGKTCPAGVYTFAPSQSRNGVSMKEEKGKVYLQLRVITALARSSEEDDHLLAFDKLEGKRILSEVWLPGRDGVLVHGTAGDHSHDVIRLKAASDETR